MKKKQQQNGQERHDLAPLIEELERLNIDQKSGLRFNFWVMVGISVLFGLGQFLSGSNQGLAGLMKQMQSSKSSSFRWTEEDVIKLDLGISEDEVVAIYGPAHERQVYDTTDTIILTYQFDDPVQFKKKLVTLSFSGNLVSKFSYALETAVVKPLDDARQVHVFTVDEVNNLRVGNSNTGQGGISLTELLSQYGQPTEVTSSLYEEASSIYSRKNGLEKTLVLTYQQPQAAPYQWVNLTFRALGQTEFHLSAKDTD